MNAIEMRLAMIRLSEELEQLDDDDPIKQNIKVTFKEKEDTKEERGSEK